MKLTIKQNLLMEHLNYVIKGISNKNIIPILNCIKFDLEKNGLYLLSTDNDIAIKTFIDKKEITEISELGSFVISGKYIYDIVRKLPNEIINLEEIIDSKLLIYTNNSSFNLNTNKVTDFPSIDLEENKNPIIMSQQIFKNIINQTAFASSNDQAKPVLTGINFKINENNLECTSTDSYRLSRKTIQLSNTNESTNIIVPTRNLLELIKLFNNEENILEMHVFNNKVIFKFDSIVLMSRLINGTYPDTNRLIPNEFETTIRVSLTELYNSLDRASLLTNENEKNTIKLQVIKNKLIISSNIPEIGNVEEKIEPINKNINDMKIAFSSKYMLDALKSFNSEEVELLFNGEIKPIIVRNVDSNDVIQLIVPIRTY
jgi:DNA polymerase-3 subunit beta